MAIKLIRTYLALTECEEHLKITNTKGTLIESYLTGHVLVIFCADIQQCVYKMLENRVNLSDDTGLRSFVVVSGRKNLRSANFNKISEIVGYFGEDVKRKFNESLVEKDITIYGNAVRDRNIVTHSQGTDISFNDLKEAVAAGVRIMEAFEKVISP